MWRQPLVKAKKSAGRVKMVKAMLLMIGAPPLSPSSFVVGAIQQSVDICAQTTNQWTPYFPGRTDSCFEFFDRIEIEASELVADCDYKYDYAYLDLGLETSLSFNSVVFVGDWRTSKNEKQNYTDLNPRIYVTVTEENPEATINEYQNTSLMDYFDWRWVGNAVSQNVLTIDQPLVGRYILLRTDAVAFPEYKTPKTKVYQVACYQERVVKRSHVQNENFPGQDDWTRVYQITSSKFYFDCPNHSSFCTDKNQEYYLWQIRDQYTDSGTSEIVTLSMPVNKVVSLSMIVGSTLDDSGAIITDNTAFAPSLVTLEQVSYSDGAFTVTRTLGTAACDAEKLTTMHFSEAWTLELNDYVRLRVEPASAILAALILHQQCASANHCHFTTCVTLDQVDNLNFSWPADPTTNPLTMWMFSTPAVCNAQFDFSVVMKNSAGDLVNYFDAQLDTVSESDTQLALKLVINDAQTMVNQPSLTDLSFELTVTDKIMSFEMLQQTWTTASYTNACETAEFQSLAEPITIELKAGSTDPVITKLGDLMLDSVTELGGGSCARQYQLQTPLADVSTVLQALSVDTDTGELTTTLAATAFQEPTAITINVSAEIQVNDITFDTMQLAISLSVVMCKTATYCKHSSCITLHDENTSSSISYDGPMSQLERWIWRMTIPDEACVGKYQLVDQTSDPDGLVTMQISNEATESITIEFQISDQNNPRLAKSQTIQLRLQLLFPSTRQELKVFTLDVSYVNACQSTKFEENNLPSITIQHLAGITDALQTDLARNEDGAPLFTDSASTSNENNDGLTFCEAARVYSLVSEIEEVETVLEQMFIKDEEAGLLETRLLASYKDSFKYTLKAKVEIVIASVKYDSLTFSILLDVTSTENSVQVKLLYQKDLLDQSFFQQRVHYGLGWSLQLPPGYYPGQDTLSYQDISNKKPVYSSLMDAFMTYDSDQEVLSIAEGQTSEADVGTYRITLSLQDNFETDSESLIITLLIYKEEVEGPTEPPVVEPPVEAPENKEEVQISADLAQYFKDQLMKAAEKRTQAESEGKLITKPRAQLKKPNSLGKFSIEFSKSMQKVPDLDKRISKLLQTESLHDSQSKRMLQSQDIIGGEVSQEPVIIINLMPGDSSELEDLGYDLTIDSYSEASINFKLEFKFPEKVSRSEFDVIEVEFSQINLFFDSDGQTLDLDTIYFKEAIVPQYSSEEQKKALEATKAAIGTGGQSLLALNFIMSFIAQASLQYLWEMITAQQIVALLPLFKINKLPKNVGAIFSGLMWIAAAEVIPTDIIYQWLFKLDDEDDGIPINANFQQIGLEHHLFLRNFGTLGFVAIFVIPPLYITQWLLDKCRGYRCCRKTADRLHKKLYWSIVIRATIESYVIGFICCLINIERAIHELCDATLWSKANTYMSFGIMPVFVLFPVLSITYMYRHHESLGQKHEKARFGELYSGYSLKRRRMLVFWGLEYVRKILLGLVVVVFHNSLWLQIVTLFCTSTMILIAVGYIHIRRSKFDQIMDILNEVKLCFIMYHLILFTDFGPNEQTQIGLGYSCAAVLILGTSFNMAVIFLTPLKKCKRNLLLRCLLKKARAVSKRIDGKGFNARRLKARADQERRTLEILDEVFALQQEQLEIEEHNRLAAIEDDPSAQHYRSQVSKSCNLLSEEQLRQLETFQDYSCTIPNTGACTLTISSGEKAPDDIERPLSLISEEHASVESESSCSGFSHHASAAGQMQNEFDGGKSEASNDRVLSKHRPLITDKFGQASESHSSKQPSREDENKAAEQTFESQRQHSDGSDQFPMRSSGSQSSFTQNQLITINMQLNMYGCAFDPRKARRDWPPAPSFSMAADDQPEKQTDDQQRSVIISTTDKSRENFEDFDVFNSDSISDILSIPGYENFLFSAETDKRAKPPADEAQRALQLSQLPSYVPSELDKAAEESKKPAMQATNLKEPKSFFRHKQIAKVHPISDDLFDSENGSGWAGKQIADTSGGRRVVRRSEIVTNDYIDSGLDFGDKDENDATGVEDELFVNKFIRLNSEQLESDSQAIGECEKDESKVKDRLLLVFDYDN